MNCPACDSEMELDKTMRMTVGWWCPKCKQPFVTVYSPIDYEVKESVKWRH